MIPKPQESGSNEDGCHPEHHGFNDESPETSQEDDEVGEEGGTEGEETGGNDGATAPGEEGTELEKNPGDMLS